MALKLTTMVRLEIMTRKNSRRAAGGRKRMWSLSERVVKRIEKEAVTVGATKPELKVYSPGVL